MFSISPLMTSPSDSEAEIALMELLSNRVEQFRDGKIAMPNSLNIIDNRTKIVAKYLLLEQFVTYASTLKGLEQTNWINRTIVWYQSTMQLKVKRYEEQLKDLQAKIKPQIQDSQISYSALYKYLEQATYCIIDGKQDSREEFSYSEVLLEDETLPNSSILGNKEPVDESKPKKCNQLTCASFFIPEYLKQQEKKIFSRIKMKTFPES